MIFTYIRSRMTANIEKEISQLEEIKERIYRLADANKNNGFDYEAQKMLEYGAKYVDTINSLMKKKEVG